MKAKDIKIGNFVRNESTGDVYLVTDVSGFYFSAMVIYSEYTGALGRLEPIIPSYAVSPLPKEQIKGFVENFQSIIKNWERIALSSEMNQ